MKAILYARFSPRPNASECESVVNQLTELREHCQRLGWEIAGEFFDEALSGGSDWESRPGMLDATKAARRGMTLLVRSYDRLFRDVDKAMMFRAMLEAKGVEVASMTEAAANGATMHAKLIRFVFLWIAEYQREVIKARTKTRMLEHQRNGRRMSARTPYGTMVDPADPARLAGHEGEQAVILQILERHEAGETAGAIARWLTESGIMNRAGRPWHPEQVRRVVRRAKP